MSKEQSSKGSVLVNFQEKWISYAALSSAVLAVLAGLTGATSTSHGNLATRDLIRNSNQWNYFQAKSIKANLLQTKLDLMVASKSKISDSDQDKLKQYKNDQSEIVKITKDQEASIDTHLRLAGLFTSCVTFLQIGIGIVAVSILTKRPAFWLVGLGLAGYGLHYAVLAYL